MENADHYGNCIERSLDRLFTPNRTEREIANNRACLKKLINDFCNAPLYEFHERYEEWRKYFNDTKQKTTRKTIKTIVNLEKIHDALSDSKISLLDSLKNKNKN